MAAFIINCPNCHHQFEPGESMREEIQKELRTQMVDWQNKKDQEFKLKEQSFQQIIADKEKEAKAEKDIELTQVDIPSDE